MNAEKKQKKEGKLDECNQIWTVQKQQIPDTVDTNIRQPQQS